MRISFHHANPDAGNESFLLRFDGEGDESPCVLVDAGHDVDLDAILTSRDRLAAICLSHAHLDHYSELAGAHRDDAPIFTSSATAAVMEDVLDVAETQYGVRSSDELTDAITPIDGWTDVTSDIEVTPVPAGHVPGAVGYLVRVTDGARSHHLLATGDFTRRRAGGFPGFDAEGFADVDALFLTGATDDRFESAITEALGTVLEHAHGGAHTLLATSGLVGVQCAYLLAALTDKYDLRVPVRVVGQVAKLYDALDYDCAGVEKIPYFEHTDECLEPGTVTIAGPEIPIEQSSGRLFGVLREDPGACVVQLIGSGEDPITDAKCTVHAYELVSHPTRQTLVEVHDSIEPIQTIVTHRHDGARGAFNDLDSVVWGPGDREEYTLYSGEQWRLPPWVDGTVLSREPGRDVGQFAGVDLLASFPVPSLDRHDEPDLPAEGIGVDRIASLLHRGPDVAGELDEADEVGRPTDRAGEPENETATMTDESTEESASTKSEVPRTTGLVDTVDPGLGDEIDPEIEAVLEERGLTEETVAAMLAAMRRGDEQNSPQDDEVVEDEAEDGESKDHSAEVADESGKASAGSSSGESEGGADAEVDTHTDGDETHADTPSDPDLDADRGELTPPVASNGSGGRGDGDEDPYHLELNPIALGLAEREVDESDEAEFGSLDAVIVEAVDAYVVSLLAGEASGSEEERFTLELSVSPSVERALEPVVDDDDRFESTSALVSEAVGELLGDDQRSGRGVCGLGPYGSHLDAIIGNDAYAFTSAEEIVAAAIARFSANQ